MEKGLIASFHEKQDYSKPTHKVLTASFFLNDSDIKIVKENGGKVYCDNQYWEVDTPLDNLVPGMNRIVLTRTLKM